MKRLKKTSSGTLELAQALRARVRVKAPVSLLPAVLARVGLSDSYWRLESPLGPVYVAHSKAGISMVSRARSAEEFEREFRRSHGRAAHREKSPPPAHMRTLLASLKSPERRRLHYDLRGLSEFERAVLLKALEIPDGEVRPYSWIAKEIGHPEAIRAVGSALGKNPIPLLIPCHRVVRADGHIGEYSMGGPRNKRTLLQIEGAQPETLEKLAASRVRYLGNQEQRHYCYPTCGGIKTLVLSNKVPFHSEREAVAAGYHPCGDCRPLAA